MNHLITPHGGELVNLIADKEQQQVLKDLSMHIASISLSERLMCDLELLINGAFSPLKGFMTNPEYESVLDRMRLQDGTFWPMPICLDITDVEAA
ncbi:MAG: adenylyltransferase, partial [Deltaproteobacteria bacterium]|nr:adenylyltransferase [Deltaproteobacteria bacterium]